MRADSSGPMAGAAAEPSSALPPQTKRQTLKELREACKSLGLSTNGKKEVLSQRLLNHNLRDDLGDLASQADDDADVAVGETGARVQAPMFTKNEFARLFHVLALPSVAAAVVAVRGRLTLQQKTLVRTRWMCGKPRCRGTSTQPRSTMCRQPVRTLAWTLPFIRTSALGIS